MKNKVLIITYYWPPAGGPGVQRWLKFVKYLPDYDIDPIVYIPENPHYPLQDPSLNFEVSESLTIVRKSIKEPYAFAHLFTGKASKTMSKGIISDTEKQSFLEKLLLFIRGNFFIPDARKSWVKPSVKYLHHYLNTHKIDTVITTGPPHSLHLIGLGLKQKLNIKWIADFRDPWTTIGYHKQLRLTRWAQKKHKKLEKAVLQRADTILVTSQVTQYEFEQMTSKPVKVITNGFDDEGIMDVSLDSKFSLAHIGSLLSKRNPEILWEVLSEIVQENSEFASDLELKMVGAVSEQVLKTIHHHGLSNFVNEIGYVPHNEAIKIQKESQVLLLIEIDSEATKCIIPGKLFEYMVANRPILAFGPMGSDVERIVTETNTGNYFYYDASEALKTTILVHYKAFKNNALKTQPIGLQQYHRRALTESLSKLL